MSENASNTAQTFDGLARDKLVRVLGRATGERVFAETLQHLRRTQIDTADDLYAFGEELTNRGGFEAAVGRLLSVAAVMRGARGR